MSSRWFFYNAETGVFLRGSMVLPSEQAVAINTPSGYVATDIPVDPVTQRMDVSTGLLVPYTPAGAPTQLDAPTARQERDRRLAACDWVRARADDLGQPVPAAWLTYRQALRDITAQPGFPLSITWPTPPTT